MSGPLYPVHPHLSFCRGRVTAAAAVAAAGAPKEFGRLSDRAVLLLDEMPFGVFVETLFNDTGTETLDLGYGAHNTRTPSPVVADPNNFATLLSMTTTGWKPVDEAAGADRLVNCDKSGFPLVWDYAGASGDASAGSAEIIVPFVPAIYSDTTGA